LGPLLKVLAPTFTSPAAPRSTHTVVWVMMCSGFIASVTRTGLRLPASLSVLRPSSE